jgi:DNA-binding PadR family transcriptional regulator
MRASTSKSVSLSPERLAILLALADERASGTNIASKIIGDTTGDIYLKSTTLYRLLHELEHRGYIISDNAVYDLAPKGWATLERELPRAKQHYHLLQIRLSPRQYKAAPSAN